MVTRTEIFYPSQNGSFTIIDFKIVQEFIASIISQLLAMIKGISSYWNSLHFQLTNSMSNHQFKIMTTNPKIFSVALK